MQAAQILTARSTAMAQGMAMAQAALVELRFQDPAMAMALRETALAALQVVVGDVFFICMTHFDDELAGCTTLLSLAKPVLPR